MEEINDKVGRALSVVEENAFNYDCGLDIGDLRQAKVTEYKDFVAVQGNNENVYLVRFLNGHKFDSEFWDFDVKRMELFANGYELTRCIYDPRRNIEFRIYSSDRRGK